jgi:hypothetical protein
MRAAIGIIIFLIAIQFIKIDCVPVIKSDPKDEIIVPQNVKAILKRSCYDCHSNNSVIPWYGNVAPSSWFVRSHINDGRYYLNFSTFNTLSKDKQKDKYGRIGESIVIRMPLPSYLWIHTNSALSDEDRKVLKEWSDKEYDKL